MLIDLLADLRDMATATEWMTWALCSETDPEAFFPPDQAGPNWYAAAVRICEGCPVRDECLAYALENEIPYGVWGGLTERERQPAAVPQAA